MKTVRSENENVTEELSNRKNSKTEKVETEKVPEQTIRDFTKGDTSVLEDLKQCEKTEKERIKSRKWEDILQNKMYGWDEPFINDVMNVFNTHLNEEGKIFTSLTEAALNKEDEVIEDNDANILFKLVLDEKERMLFKELLLNTTKYPICINIGDYDFFFEMFDNEGKDPIFSFSKMSFSFFFNNDIEKLKNYLKANKVKFGVKNDRNITFEYLSLEIINKNVKIVPEEKIIEEKEIIVEKTPVNSEYRNTYKVKTKKKSKDFFVITDNPNEIYNFHGVDNVVSIKLIGKGMNF
jgi:hypothetical protein